MKRKFYIQLAIFLTLNFGALAIGGLYTNSGVISDWYNNLNQAPWTPPGFMFGLAWTMIMICLAVYMAKALELTKTKKLLTIYGIQLILNISWNPIFFYYHLTVIGLIVISLLAIVVFLLYIRFNEIPKVYRILLLPYMIWIVIATSLNGYIVFMN